MTPVIPKIAIFSINKINKTFRTSADYRWMAKGFETYYFNNDVSVNDLHKLKISAVVFVGSTTTFRQAKRFNLLKLFFNTENDITGDIIYGEIIKFICSDINPKISIFTPAYKTLEKFDRVYNSVISQSYDNWEWVILDDSPNEENFNYIKNIIKDDYRIRLFKSNTQDGFIGSTKRKAASLCNGDYLLELDHDDELYHLALEYIVNAFKKYPDAGFCYTDCCEVYEDGGNVVYGKGYAMGHGLHFKHAYKGEQLVGSDTPINSNTIRHIVGVPNHIRCWRKDVYNKINRHNDKLYIVDDYELIVRTFLETRFIHIQEVLYKQYMNSGGNNTQEPRRAEIQRLVDWIQKHYDVKIHERIKSLGYNDWCWINDKQQSDPRYYPKGERKTFAYVYKV